VDDRKIAVLGNFTASTWPWPKCRSAFLFCLETDHRARSVARAKTGFERRRHGAHQGLNDGSSSEVIMILQKKPRRLRCETQYRHENGPPFCVLVSVAEPLSLKARVVV